MAQPSYVLVEEAGPEHRKTFTVEVRLHTTKGDSGAEFVGRAQGSTKKTAEQDAGAAVIVLSGFAAAIGGSQAGAGSRSAEQH